MNINHNGKMIDYTISKPGKRLVTITLKSWDEKFELIFKKGWETEGLQEDLESLVEQLKILND